MSPNSVACSSLWRECARVLKALLEVTRKPQTSCSLPHITCSSGENKEAGREGEGSRDLLCYKQPRKAVHVPTSAGLQDWQRKHISGDDVIAIPAILAIQDAPRCGHVYSHTSRRTEPIIFLDAMTCKPNPIFTYSASCPFLSSVVSQTSFFGLLFC